MFLMFQTEASVSSVRALVVAAIAHQMESAVELEDTAASSVKETKNENPGKVFTKNGLPRSV